MDAGRTAFMPGFLPVVLVDDGRGNSRKTGREHASDVPRKLRQNRRDAMRISAFGKTDRGRVRSNNEDDLAIVDLTTAHTYERHEVEHLEVGAHGVLLAVCDGVGGRRAGEVASALALNALAHEMESLGDGCPRGELFRCAVENVNRRVWEQGHSDPALEGMATTLTAAVVCRERTIVAHVGDSRAYVFRGGSMRQITRDQSFVASLLASGALTPEEAARSPYRSVILQAIGRRKSVQVALDALETREGDLLLLCTDGLSEKLTAEEMARALEGRPMGEGVGSLIDQANQRGGEDNITAIAARIES
jgi:serine/threonine protein phosphatase PrpC